MHVTNFVIDSQVTGILRYEILVEPQVWSMKKSNVKFAARAIFLQLYQPTDPKSILMIGR